MPSIEDPRSQAQRNLRETRKLAGKGAELANAGVVFNESLLHIKGTHSYNAFNSFKKYLEKNNRNHKDSLGIVKDLLASGQLDDKDKKVTVVNDFRSFLQQKHSELKKEIEDREKSSNVNEGFRALANFTGFGNSLEELEHKKNYYVTLLQVVGYQAALRASPPASPSTSPPATMRSHAAMEKVRSQVADLVEKTVADRYELLRKAQEAAEKSEGFRKTGTHKGWSLPKAISSIIEAVKAFFGFGGPKPR